MAENGTGGVTRRDFIKIASVGGGGLVVGALAGSQMFPKKVGSTGVPEKWDKEVDVVVVGGGGAGLAAAISANKEGAKVLVLEKMSGTLTSSTAICGGFITFCGTDNPEEKRNK